MALKTTAWDSADYLRTEEERAAYLAACMEEAPEDAAFIAHALGVVARSRNMSELARDTGLTREGLYKSLSTTGNPSFGTILKVVHALGYRLTLEPGEKKGARAIAKRSATKARKAAAKGTTSKRSAPKTPVRKAPSRTQPRI